MFWGRSDHKSSFQKVIMGANGVSAFCRLCIIGSFSILAGNSDLHQSLEEFEILPDLRKDFRVSFPSASEKNPHRLIIREMVSPHVLVV